MLVRFGLYGTGNLAGRNCLSTVDTQRLSRETLHHKGYPLQNSEFGMWSSESSQQCHSATVTESRVVEHPAVNLLAVYLWPLYL